MRKVKSPCPVAITTFFPGHLEYLRYSMGSVRQHIASIERYERFLAFLKSDGSYPDWAVVAVFYIAVHYSRSLLSHENILVTSHPAAQAAFYKTFGDRACYTHLEFLKRPCSARRAHPVNHVTVRSAPQRHGCSRWPVGGRSEAEADKWTQSFRCFIPVPKTVLTDGSYPALFPV